MSKVMGLGNFQGQMNALVNAYERALEKIDNQAVEIRRLEAKVTGLNDGATDDYIQARRLKPGDVIQFPSDWLAQQFRVESVNPESYYGHVSLADGRVITTSYPHGWLEVVSDGPDALYRYHSLRKKLANQADTRPLQFSVGDPVLVHHTTAATVADLPGFYSETYLKAYYRVQFEDGCFGAVLEENLSAREVEKEEQLYPAPGEPKYSVYAIVAWEGEFMRVLDRSNCGGKVFYNLEDGSGNVHQDIPESELVAV